MTIQGFWTSGMDGTKDRLNTALLQRDTLANRPAASSANTGMEFFATNESKLYRSNGTTWDLIQPLGTPDIVALQAFGG